MSFIAKSVRPALRLSSAAKQSSVAAVRQKHTLPDLPYDYAALEPAISGKIMEVAPTDLEKQWRS